MLLDLFYELAMPPLLERSETRAYTDALEEIALADRLGFHGVWLVEHHSTPGYSHLSKPDLVLAALSQRTSRLRLGLGVIPLPYHHPLHVAERIGTLDLLCGGRLEVGIGRGFSPREYAAFGIDPARSRELVEESLAVLRAAGADAPVFHHGPGFHIEGMTVLPRPLQRPYPPLWTAAVSPETFEWAAREGLGVLAGPFKPWPMIAADVRRYRDAWRHREPPRVGMTVGMLCLEDGRRARAMAGPALRWSYGELLRVTAPVLERLVPGYEHFRELGRFRRLFELGARLRVLELAGLVIVGTPAHCRERLEQLREAGVTHLLCAIGAGAVPTELVRESLECLASDVLPRVREAH